MVKPLVVGAVQTAPRKHSLGKFMHHDPMQAGVFNRTYCSAGGPTAQWADDLTNSPEILDLLCQRLQGDFEALAPKMRKNYTAASVEPSAHSKLLKRD